MPAKNALKDYVGGGCYHVYNRGVNKMNVFEDEQDYAVFLGYLKSYLLPKETEKLIGAISDPKVVMKEKSRALRELEIKNFDERIDLLAYCLMPNHFHFCLKQIGDKDMELFMRALMSRYTAYFNRRHKRVGPLWQGRYKAVLVETDEQLLYLTWYIHRNVVGLFRVFSKRTVPIGTVLASQPSSYQNYLGKVSQGWVKPESVLVEFEREGGSRHKSYREFVESEEGDDEEEVKWRLVGLAENV